MLLLLLALANVGRLTERSPDVHRAVDLRNVYLGQLLLQEGENPYEDERLKSRWQELALEEGIRPESQPGFPDNPLLYPPWALSLFLGLATLSYTSSTGLWYLMMLILLLGSVYFLAKDRESRMGILLDMLLLSLAFKGTIHAWIVGQPTFLCFFAIFAAYYCYQKEQHFWAGILLGIAAFKPTLAGPLLILMLLNRRWRSLAWASLAGMLMWGLACMLTEDVWLMHSSLAENVAHFQQILFDPGREDYPLYFTMTQITELGALGECLITGFGTYRSWVYVLLLGPCFFWLIWKKWQGQINDLATLLGFFFVFFLGTYHQFYDLLILLPLYFWAGKLEAKEKILLLLLASPLFLPVNGLLNALNLPEFLNVLYFSTPLSVLLMAVLFFRREVVDSYT